LSHPPPTTRRKAADVHPKGRENDRAASTQKVQRCGEKHGSKVWVTRRHHMLVYFGRQTNSVLGKRGPGGRKSEKRQASVIWNGKKPSEEKGCPGQNEAW